jgi:type IV secretory pathway VirB10-like protein
MNTIWLKIAAVIVAIVIIFVLITIFTSGSTEESQQPEQPDKPRNFAQQVEADKEKFLTEPQPVEEKKQESAVEDQNVPQQAQTVQQPPKPAQPTTLYFKELGEIEKIEAERLLNVAVPGLDIGKLPITGYKLMVDTCRQIIKRWPESWYAYRAKQMLTDMPERYKQRYNVTQEEMDLSMYAEPRTGTQPYTIKETR